MRSEYVLPITIVVAGALIAGAVFLVGKNGAAPSTVPTANLTARAYDAKVDHLLGNPNAQVKVVEYMDLECPHCKIFETTMHQVMDYYGASGKVAWVSRAFPLTQIHTKAATEAQAAECAAEQGGDAAYFKFIDKLFEVTPSDNGFDLTQLPTIAGQVGLNTTAFNSCLSSNKYAQKVSDSYNEAIGMGAQGTPFILVMVGTDAVTLNGAQPYDSMRAAIDAVLQGASSTTTSATTK